jgi:hypothetical protein
MDESQALQYAVSALGVCICAIGWWIGTRLESLGDKVERVLIQMEAHQARIARLEKQGEM